MAKVLVVDDDKALLRALTVGLSAHGYEVITASDGSGGITRTAVDKPDVVLLDLGLPDIDGLDVCNRIRQWTDVPVIVLSAAGSEQRKVAALDGGADDYVTKPFGMAELEARIRAALRHSAKPASQGEEQRIDVGDLHLDLVHYEARMDDQPIELTSKEFELLAFLARNSGRLCTQKMILEEVWGHGYSNESQYLRVYVYRLRRKLGPTRASMLKTSPGVGYTLVAPDEAS
jgi:two-component system KDP operon response regulator KdpE